MAVGPMGMSSTEMGGTGSDFLGQDGRHHLPGRIDVQRPLDRDQHVVSGRQVGGAAPDQTAAVPLHDAGELLERQLHIRQHLHGVGGAGGRGDGARRRLGKHQPIGRHDGHHQHRGAVARNAADAVLVDHQRRLPVKPPAAGHHGFGEEIDLFAVQLAAVAGDHERGQLDLGIAVAGDVAHDRGELFAAQPLAVDLAKQRRHGHRRLGLRNRGGMAVGHIELGKGVFRHTELTAAHDGGVVHHVERGQDAVAIGVHLHLGERLEALGPVDRAVSVEVGHVLVVRVDGHPLE